MFGMLPYFFYLLMFFFRPFHIIQSDDIPVLKIILTAEYFKVINQYRDSHDLTNSYKKKQKVSKLINKNDFAVIV